MTGTRTTVRPALAGDVDAITALVRAAYQRWVPVIGREPRPMVADYATAIERHRVDLLLEHDRLVGLIETVLHGDHLWIENVAVAPQEQGRGLGTMLLAHAETIAVAARLAEIRLLTNAAFASNVLLYERKGYALTHQEPYLGGTTLYMRKRLSS